MASPGQSVPRYRFGVFTVDTHSGELRKHGTQVKLQERPFQLLVALVERPGEVVTREELRRRLWPGGTFVDFDHSISSSVNKLRSALNDSSTHPHFIETVGRRGYRFLADVKAVSAAGASLEKTPASCSVSGAPARARLSPFRRWVVVMGGVALVAAGTIGYFQRTRFRAQSGAPAGRVVVAVLPFENLTGDAGQDYFSDGLTEEMISQLGRLDPEHLGVIARTSVMHYKNSQEPLEQISRELGVQYVLEGSVRRDSDRVRIAAQLIQVRDQTHLWSRQYDRDLSNLLALQGEIAQEITDEIQLALGERKRNKAVLQPALSPQSYESYEFYLKGRYFLNRRTPESLQQAIEYFHQAVARDPNYARAYAGLADSYGLISGYNLTPRTESMPKARAAALRALQIDDRLAEAHSSLALIAELYDWDWQTAEKEFRRAIELDPNYATAHHWYAEYLGNQGRFDEAFAESERARRLDPLSLIIAADNGAILYFSRQYDPAIEKFRAVLEMEPNFPRAHMVDSAYVQKGMYADALADIEKWRRVQDGPLIWGYLAYVYGRSGQRLRAQHELEKLEQFSRRRPMDPGPILLAHIGMGNKDEAFAWFEKAYLAHSGMLTTLKVEPIYDPLRNDPRFADLLRRVGLQR